MPGSDLSVVHRSCVLCEAHCGISVEVDRAANRVSSIKGDPDDPFSRGYICPKAVGMGALATDPDRVVHPLRRVGGDFEEIGWDEAMDLVVERFQHIQATHGKNALATYLGNPNAHDFASNLAVPSLIRGLGTRWRFSASSVDQWPKMFSSGLLYGSVGALPVPDVDHTDYMLMLGANPLASNGSIMTAPDIRGRLRRLRERGGKLVVVDPRRSETARVSDRHLAIRPGSDAFFLFALVHVLFDEDLVDLGHLADCTNGVEDVRTLAREFAPETVADVTGIAASDVRTLAREFAAADSAVCYGRIGTCTQEFGALSSWLVDVVNVLTGNLDRPGGALFPWPAHAPASDQPARLGRFPYARWKSRVRGLPEFAGELPVATLAEEIETPGEGQVRALLSVAGNPVLSTPNALRLDRALASLDFMVSIDLYVNETTRHADIILPTTTAIERTNYDMAFHNLSVRNFAKWSPKVLEPPPGVRDLFEICTELSGRMNGVDGNAVREMMVGGLINSVVGVGKACEGVSEAEVRERIAKHEGPARMLDLMIRAGRVGDRFREGADGMTLDSLVAAEHGVDLGPLASRLPAMLATESGHVELAPPLLVDDVERLRGALAAGRPEVVLVGRRQIRTNNSWMHNVPALAKGKPRCTLLVHPDDAARHGLRDGASARVRSRVGEVVAPVEISDEMRPGVVSLPHGFGHDRPGARLRVAGERQRGVNSNALTDEEGIDVLSGNAILNGIPVDLAPAPS